MFNNQLNNDNETDIDHQELVKSMNKIVNFIEPTSKSKHSRKTM